MHGDVYVIAIPFSSLWAEHVLLPNCSNVAQCITQIPLRYTCLQHSVHSNVVQICSLGAIGEQNFSLESMSICYKKYILGGKL